ncbi:CU044_5270 family protein [Streptomyces sp. S.PB5]|uniref:CU044_5270 family protein n=1 Tax=Streptomyces sp. S.PB5 TaxID=3020844 RepID=UPI0025B221FB|nr:CU044_5270 family protein [Streptomyces sp. S.PB5]MDN3027327.1 CU044_5270 family protein [Streptomyces sp. S.PB5]
MDDLIVVREFEADVAPLTDDARSAARVRLRRAILRDGHPRPLSRRLMLRVAVVGTATAVAAGGVAVAGLSQGGGGADGTRMATMSAAEVLHKAAARSRADDAGTPVPRDDQYVYTKTRVTRTYDKGGKRKTWTDESWISVDGSKPSSRQEYGKVHRDPPLGKQEVRWPPTEYDELAKWPTDPDQLLDKLRGDRGPDDKVVEGKAGSGEVRERPVRQADIDREAFVNAVQFYVVPRIMPPGLEAGTFEAVARIPGIRIDREVVDGLGRRGVAVSYPGFDFAFIFDATDYTYLGLRLKGSTADLVDGKVRHRDRYHETRARQELGVVDRIGQRP